MLTPFKRTARNEPDAAVSRDFDVGRSDTTVASPENDRFALSSAVRGHARVNRSSTSLSRLAHVRKAHIAAVQ
jgi:hypothetical protein